MKGTIVFSAVAALAAGAAMVVGAAVMAPSQFNSMIGTLGGNRTATSAGLTPLPDGTEAGLRAALTDTDPSALRKMLAELGSANRASGDGVPLVIVAAQIATPDALTLVLASTPNVDVAGPGGTTALMAAVMAKRPDNVERLLAAGADPSLLNQDGLSASDFARAFGQHDIVAKLGISRTRGSPVSTPSLAEAVSLADAKAIAQAIAAGANPNETSTEGWTPLMTAAALDCSDCIDVLISAGARPAESAGKNSMLSIAALSAQPATVEKVVALAPDKFGASSPEAGKAYILALRAQRLDVAKLLRPTEPGPDVEAAEALVLHEAVKKNDLPAVQALLTAGIAGDPSTAKGGTPSLLVAVRADASEAMLRLLLENRANPNGVDADGMTPLLQAILRRKVNATNTLMRAGAENWPSGARASAIELAKAAGGSFWWEFLARAAGGSFWWEFLASGGSKWLAESVNVAIANGDIATLERLRLDGGDKVAELKEAVARKQPAVAAWIVANRELSSVHLDIIAQWAAENGESVALDAIADQFDKLSLSSVLTTGYYARRRGMSGPTLEKLSAILREWQAIAVLLQRNSDVVVDGKPPEPGSPQWRALEVASQRYRDSLQVARQHLATRRIVCNASTGTIYISVLDGSGGRAYGHFDIKPGSCASYSTNTVAIALDRRQAGFSTTKACINPRDAFDYAQPRDAESCRRAGGQMSDYFVLTESGKPVHLK